MKPIAIFRHSATEGPGHFATFLDRHSIPWQLVRVDAGDPLPADSRSFAGLCFMGGPMSVNDDLPWIPPVLELIRDAVAADRPVIGHCLGGQLMSKALGGKVGRNPVKEIGWGSVRASDSPLAAEWLDGLSVFEAFHWHGETFTIPESAARILGSAACPNQAFVLGKHLGMQCHVEMTEEMIRSWCESGAGEIASCTGQATVQQPAEMLSQVGPRLAALHDAAERLYTRWIAGLQRN